MSKFPLYRQLYQMDCGAACVKMIATYHGQDASIDEIRKFCNVGSDGVSLKGLCVALENLGFNTLAGKLGFDDLCTKAPLPCILHWNQDHFVVLYKIKSRFHKRVFYVADPGRGFIQYKEAEFRENWISTNSNGLDKGTILLVEKGLFFDYKRKPSHSEKTVQIGKLGFLWQYIKRYRSYFFQLLLGTAFCSIIVFCLPFLTQSIVDVGISSKSLSFIYLVLAGQMTLLFGNATVDFLQTRILLHIGARINISLISDFFIKLMKLPMSFFDTRLIGDILQRIEDHKRINQFLTNQLIGLSFSLLTFLAFSIVLLVFNKTIFITFMAFSAVYGIWLLVFLKQRRALDYKLFDQQAKNQSKTYQLIESIQETKLHNAENRKRWEWEDIQAEIFDTNLDLLKLQQTQQAGGVFISEARNTVITVLAAASVINGLGSLGMMVAVLFIAGQLSNPIERIMNFIYHWQDVNISLDRIKEIHDEENDDYLKTVTSLDDYDRTIKVQEVSFKYPGIRNNYVIKNLSFEIKEGETLAIVGASGSGKTTLLKLLLGYYSPTYGSISIGDIPLSTINQTWWHNRCGVVMQDGFIYSDSIAGNIAVAYNHPDIGKLKNAAQIAKIDSFISRLPLKYNTKIGEDGIGLSKGQKQRVLIARAVYKDPDYLILDEATNSLDANTERDIVSDLERFYDGKTAIIVAHRLSTVKRADHIIVLDDGEIVEQGTHSELVSQKGYYYQLIKNQLDLDA